MMENDVKFVDLRVLLVEQTHEGHSLLQLALDELEFDRLVNTFDYESTLDQLCFNNFDLLILCNSLPEDTLDAFAKNSKKGALRHERNMEIFSLNSTGEQPLSSCELLQALHQAFQRAQKKRTASQQPRSRLERLEHSLASGR